MVWFKHVIWLLSSKSAAARWQRSLIQAEWITLWSPLRRGLSLGAAIFAIRTDVTSVKLVNNLDVTPAGTAVDQPNGMRIVFRKLRHLFILVSNTSASTRVVTVRKATNSSDNPASDFASTAIPITTGLGLLGPFNGRYVQADGTIWLDFVAGHTGNVMPFEVPD